MIAYSLDGFHFFKCTPIDMLDDLELDEKLEVGATYFVGDVGEDNLVANIREMKVTDKDLAGYSQLLAIVRR